MRAIIFVRTNVDWATMDMDKFYAQKPHLYSSHLVKWLQETDIVPIWNEIFHLTYFQFRAKLQRLAELTLVRNRQTKIIRGLGDLRQELADRRPAVIIPIDDDDWLWPTSSLVARRIANRAKGRSIFWWRQGVLDSGHWHTLNFFSVTLNTTFRKNFLLENYSEDDVAYILANHGKAKVLQKDHPSKVLRVNRILGVTNKTLASLSRLQGFGGRLKNVNWSHVLMLHARRYAQRPVHFPKSRWLAEYIERNIGIHRKLLGI